MDLFTRLKLRLMEVAALVFAAAMMAMLVVGPAMILTGQPAQQGATTTISGVPPDSASATTNRLFYDGSTNCGGKQCLVYICTALSQQSSFAFSIVSSTLTSIVDSGNTATINFAVNSGLNVDNRIFIRNASVSALNGYFTILTIPTATSATVATSGVADATYADTFLQVETMAPRTSAAVWKVEKIRQTSDFLTASRTNSQPVGGQICDNRATLAYN
jgi:hypothetical protein